MNAINIIIAAGLTLTPIDVPKTADDAAKLQGVWDYTGLEIEGKPVAPAMFAGSKIEIAGDTFTTTTGTIVYKGTMKLDTTQKPKTVDVTFTEGPEKGNTAKGIYELDGDSWKICIPVKGDNRPKAFATKAGDGFALEMLKRRKLVVTDAAFKAELVKLAGEWSMDSGESNGQAAPDDLRKSFKRVTKDDETTLIINDMVVVRAKIAIDPSKKPKEIDYNMLEGPNKGKKQLGIYEFDGEAFKVCIAAPDGKRPTDFTADEGSGCTSSVWAKVKK